MRWLMTESDEEEEEEEEASHHHLFDAEEGRGRGGSLISV